MTDNGRVGTRLPERNLDVLRAIAVLCVLVDHTMLATIAPSVEWLADLGRVGVLLFFVHTALVLMASLERSHESVGAFYVRRAFRIYPLAIATILGVVLLGVPTVGHITAARLVANLTLTQNLFGQVDLLGPLWSLPLEVQMYLVLPLCFAIASRGVRVTVLLLVLAAAVGLLVLTEPRLWRLSVALFGPCFVSGVLAFALLKMVRQSPLPAWSWPLVVVAVVALLVAVGATAGRPVLGWFGCVIVAACIPLVGEMGPSLLTRIAKNVAKYSYGVYLLHDPAIKLVFGTGSATPSILQWGVYLSLVAGLPIVAYYGIERPGIRLGKAVAKRLDGTHSGGSTTGVTLLGLDGGV